MCIPREDNSAGCCADVLHAQAEMCTRTLVAREHACPTRMRKAAYDNDGIVKAVRQSGFSHFHATNLYGVRVLRCPHGKSPVMYESGSRYPVLWVQIPLCSLGMSVRGVHPDLSDSSGRGGREKAGIFRGFVCKSLKQMLILIAHPLA